MTANTTEMIEIPSGEYRLGTSERKVDEYAQKYGYHTSWFQGETPTREVTLAAYAIDQYPVTNKKYAEFCRSTGHSPPFDWGGDNPPEDQLDHPVVYVNQSDAKAYADWAGMRLPTEDEWETAARGSDGRLFPWGEEFDPSACCWDNMTSATIGTSSVTAHPDGASPFNVKDMTGNVAEWCLDGPGPDTAFLKGGAWVNHEVVNLRPSARNMSGHIANASSFYGFRCVKDV